MRAMVRPVLPGKSTVDHTLVRRGAQSGDWRHVTTFNQPGLCSVIGVMRLSSSKSLAVSLLGAGLVALATGCTASGTASVAGSAVPAGATASASPSSGVAGNGGTAPSAAASGGGSSTTAPGAAVPSATPAANGSGGLAVLACPTSGLKVAEGSGNAGAGSVYIPIEFTNTSGRTCTLFGYPGVALTTSAAPSGQVGAAATRSAASPARVITLAPGASASASLKIAQVANYPAASCGPVSAKYLQVYPPGQKGAVYLPYTGQGCSKPVFVLGIDPVVAGTAGV